MTILLLATLPFAAKIAVLWIGAVGYGMQSLYKIFQIAIPCVARLRAGHKGTTALWPTEEPLPTLRTWLAGIGIAVAFTGSAAWILPWLAEAYRIDPAVIRSGIDARFAVDPMQAILIVVFLSVLNSAIEELHFRVWLDRELSKMYGNRASVAVSSIAFGCMHALIFIGTVDVHGSFFLWIIAGVTVAGAAWSLLMRQRGGIHAAWLSHALTDALFLTWGLRWLGYI